MLYVKNVNISNNVLGQILMISDKVAKWSPVFLIPVSFILFYVKMLILKSPTLSQYNEDVLIHIEKLYQKKR